MIAEKTTINRSTWVDKLKAALNPGAISGYLGTAMWISDFTGHTALGSFFHDPHTASAVNDWLAATFNIVGVVTHQLQAHALIQANKSNP